MKELLTRSIGVYGIVLVVLMLPAFCSACIIISHIDTDTTFTKSQSPYIISPGGVVVPKGVTLTVDPGAVIKFESNFSQLVIDGILNVNGTPSDNVVFTLPSQCPARKRVG